MNLSIPFISCTQKINIIAWANTRTNIKIFWLLDFMSLVCIFNKGINEENFGFMAINLLCRRFCTRK